MIGPVCAVYVGVAFNYMTRVESCYECFVIVRFMVWIDCVLCLPCDYSRRVSLLLMLSVVARTASCCCDIAGCVVVLRCLYVVFR